MELTRAREQKVAQAFEDMFDETEVLSNALLRNDTHTYEAMVNVALEDEKYSEDITYRDINTTIDMVSKIDYDMWAEIYHYDESLEDYDDNDAELESKLEDEGSIIDCILNNLEKVECDVIIHDSIEDVQDMYPDYDYFEEQINQHFDKDELARIVEEDYHVAEDDYQQACIDEFGSIADIPEDMEVYVRDVQINGDIAEYLYSKFDTDSLKGYIESDQMYYDVLDTNMVNVKFEFSYDEEFFSYESNPSVEYWEQELSYAYMPDEYKEFLLVEAREHIYNLIDEMLYEEGFPNDVDSHDDRIEWNLTVDENPDMSKFAKFLYDDELVPEAWGSVREYVHSSEFYSDMYDYDFVRWFLEISTDPEDLEYE